MKALVTALVFLGFMISAMAQNDLAATENRVNEFTQKLSSRNITNWFYVKKYCSGSIEMFRMKDGSMCSSKGTYYEFYVFWKEGEQTMIKKIDNCGLFYSLPLTDNYVWSYMTENFDQIQMEPVKPYESAKVTGEPELRTAIHSCYREYVFSNGDQNVEQKFNLFQLKTSEKLPNDNYEYNNNLALINLHYMIEPIVEKSQTTLRRQE